MRIIKFILLLILLPITGCSNKNEKGLISLFNVYDEYKNEELVKKGKCYELSPYFIYSIGIDLSKEYDSSFYHDDIIQNKGKIPFIIDYDTSQIKVYDNYGHYQDEDINRVSILIQPISLFDTKKIKISLKDTTISINIKSINTDIGKSNINSVDSNINNYLNNLVHYQFNEKARLKSIDSSLYEQVGNTSVGLNLRTSEVDKLLFDSTYYPKELESLDRNVNKILYDGSYFEFDDELERNANYALFESDHTHAYPYAASVFTSEKFIFKGFNKILYEFYADYFKYYKEAFYIDNIKNIEFLFWTNEDVCTPLSRDYNYSSSSINIFFEDDNYYYLITYLWNE